jgi:dTDP-4-amino-4,6-dideoxygalactose transaminase
MIKLNNNIETRPGFYAFSEQPLYHTLALPVSSRIAKQIICLPFFYDITDDQIDYICHQFMSYAKPV